MAKKNTISNNSNVENDKLYALVSSLQNDIDSLEKKIKNRDKEDRKMTAIKRIRLFGNFLRLIAPYVVSVAICLTGYYFISGGDIPYILQKELKTNLHKVTVDSNGYTMPVNVYEEKGSLSSDDIYSYSAWDKKEDGKYHREAKIYSVDRKKEIYKTVDEVKKLLMDPNTNLDEVIGTPYSVLDEVAETVSEEDLERGAYRVTTFKYYDDNDTFMGRQEMGNNIGEGLLFTMLLAMVGCGVITFRKDSSYSYKSRREEIKDEYSDPGREDVEGLLKQKKKELKNLMG